MGEETVEGGGRLLSGAPQPPKEAHGSTAPKATPAAAPGKRPKLGALAVAVISFGSVAGGPYGIEAAVGAAGALPTLLGCLALAFLWSAPQAMVTAELSTAFPSNGGYITWVLKGCGPLLGFVNAMNCIFSAWCNLPLYPVLFASYIQSLYPSVPAWGMFLVKLTGLLLTVGLNCAGIQAVEVASILFSVIVQTPFIMLPVAAVVYGAPKFNWAGAASLVPEWKSGFAVFVSTLCWNAQGWVNVGNIASEVDNPQRSYPLGSALAVVLVAVNYIYPVAVCAALAPDPTLWDTGYFATIGQSVAPWLGVYTSLASMFSSANNFLPQMGTTARALRYAALYRMAPLPGLRYVATGPGRAPVGALLLQGLLCGVLMNFSFDVLVIVNVLYYNVGLMLQFTAFLALKYTHPDIPRPFCVPGGLPGAWAASALFFSVLVLGFYAAAVSSPWAMVILVGSNLAFLVAGGVWVKWGFYPGLLEDVDNAEQGGAGEAEQAKEGEEEEARDSSAIGEKRAVDEESNEERASAASGVALPSSAVGEGGSQEVGRGVSFADTSYQGAPSERDQNHRLLDECDRGGTSGSTASGSRRGSVAMAGVQVGPSFSAGVEPRSEPTAHGGRSGWQRSARGKNSQAAGSYEVDAGADESAAHSLLSNDFLSSGTKEDGLHMDARMMTFSSGGGDGLCCIACSARAAAATEAATSSGCGCDSTVATGSVGRSSQILIGALRADAGT